MVVSGNGARLPGCGGGVQAPVEVVRGAGTLAGDHGGAERGTGGAASAEGLALVGLEQALEDLAAAALGRFEGPDALHAEARLGVELAVLGGQPPAAVRDHADAPPGPVGDLEDVLQHGPGRGVALGPDGPGVGVVDAVLAAFQL